MAFQVAVIGTGPGRDISISGRSHSFGYLHADAYAVRDDCELVACGDIVRDYADQFADEFGIRRIYEDHETLLEEEEIDIASVCTPIQSHATIVMDCASAGVDAVHCEKPMARTWADSKAMAHQCDRHDIQLTFNHQFRFGEPYSRAKELLDNGEIGDLERVEFSGGNFFDNGTHMVDLAGYFNEEYQGDWVIGQVDYSKEHVRYGVHTSDHAFVSWMYENGVHGIAATGDDVDLTDGPYDFYDVFFRLVGTDGAIEIGRHEGPRLRARRDGEGWRTIEVRDELIGRVCLAIDDVVDALRDNEDSQLRAENALKSTEILFAGHESSRRRGRVELPMRGVYDHPLESLIESGDVQPVEKDDRPVHPSEDLQ